MFGFKKRPPPVFGALRKVLLKLATEEWAHVVSQFNEFQNKKPVRLQSISSKFPELRDLFLECIAFHCAALYLTALQSLDGEEADYVTAGAVQEISLDLDRYLGSRTDRATLQKRILSRVSELTSFQQFAPDMMQADGAAAQFPEGVSFEKFEHSTIGEHSLTTIRLLNLSKYSPEAMLVILAGRTSVVAATQTDLYQKVLEHSLPGIRLRRAFPG